MFQEREGEIRAVPYACTTRTDRTAKAQDIYRTQIRQFLGLQVTPQQFDGVEIRCVARKLFDVQPRLLRSQVRVHAAALVGPEAIPDQDNALAAEMPLQGAHEADERGVRVGGRTGLKVQASL